jgi:hypothetical protein
MLLLGEMVITRRSQNSCNDMAYLLLKRVLVHPIKNSATPSFLTAGKNSSLLLQTCNYRKGSDSEMCASNHDRATILDASVHYQLSRSAFVVAKSNARLTLCRTKKSAPKLQLRAGVELAVPSAAQRRAYAGSMPILCVERCKARGGGTYLADNFLVEGFVGGLSCALH